VKADNIKNISFIIILITITVVCFSLGIWQIDRYSQKQQIHATISSPVEIDIDELVRTKDNDTLIGRTIHLDGDFIENSVFKLDNRMYNATYGVDVFSLFREKSTSRVFLVNMGWLEIGNERSKLDSRFDFSGMHSLHAAIAAIPSKPPFVSEQDFRDAKHSDLWLFVNRNYLQQQFSLSVVPLVLHNMNPADGLKYRIETKENNAIMHILYAIQWFLFSFFALFGLIKIYK
jgi:surfeit locus 1 family protein